MKRTTIWNSGKYLGKMNVVNELYKGKQNGPRRKENNLLLVIKPTGE